MKALYGARKAEIASIPLGEMVEVPSDAVEVYRSCAHKNGLKVRIVRHYRGRTIFQLTDRSAHGALKAVLVNMKVGDQITAPSAQRGKWNSAAQRLGYSFKSKKVGKGVVLLTLRVPQKKMDVKSTLVALEVGKALNPVSRARALQLCALGWNYGIRLSRAKISTGEYVLTRAA